MKNKKLPILLENQARFFMEKLLKEYGLEIKPSCNLFLCPYGVDEIDAETRIVSDNALVDVDVDISIPQFTSSEQFAVIFLMFKEYGLIPMFPSELAEASFCSLPTDKSIGDVCRALPISEESPDFAMVVGSMIQNSGNVLRGFFIHEVGEQKVFQEELTNPKIIIEIFVNYLYNVMDGSKPCPEMQIKGVGKLPDDIVFMADVIKKIVPCVDEN